MIDRIDEYKHKRKKRQLRRVAFALVFISFSVMLAWFFESQATTTVLITTHTETESDLQSNPGLTDAGTKRAISLQKMLLSIDVVAGVNTIFATPLRATQETAEPISRSLNVPINIVDPKGVEELIEEIMDNHKGKIILIVTHSEVLPQLIAGFQGSKKIQSASLQNLDQLFVVTVPWFGKVKTLQLRYGS
jgi:broad specificity phosphatase PhoE|tara:strand:+ start:633 stop:1205 length:573 start_codon:yes stop_codon:yes gene_type:complete